MWDTILKAALPIGASLLSGASKTKDYTVDQTPYWLKEFPEYKQGYQQLLSDYMTNVYNKPYQPSSYMRRAESTDSPYLQKIQSQLDQQIQNPQVQEAPQEQAPQMDAAAMNVAADAAVGKEMYQRSMTDPMFGYGRRGGKLGFQQQLGPESTDQDFAMANRKWNMPEAAQLDTYGSRAPNATAMVDKVMAGLNPSNMKSDYNIKFADIMNRIKGV